jgi:hypothetical protein
MSKVHQYSCQSVSRYTIANDYFCLFTTMENLNTTSSDHYMIMVILVKEPQRSMHYLVSHNLCSNVRLIARRLWRRLGSEIHMVRFRNKFDGLNTNFYTFGASLYQMQVSRKNMILRTSFVRFLNVKNPW